MLKTMCDIDKHIEEISKLNQEIGRLKGKIEIAETSLNRAKEIAGNKPVYFDGFLQGILNDLKR